MGGGEGIFLCSFASGSKCMAIDNSTAMFLACLSAFTFQLESFKKRSFQK